MKNTYSTVESHTPHWRSSILSMAMIMVGGSGLLIADTAPTFTMQPTGQTVTAGQSATFTVAASGDPAASYQWFRKAGTTWTPITGANSATYTTPATAPIDDMSSFQVAATNAAGSATSAAVTLRVRYVSLTNPPVSKTVSVRTPVTLSAAATGNPPPSFQWYMKPVGSSAFSAITGAAYPSYTIQSTPISMNGATFLLQIRNAYTSVTSAPITLTVVSTPVFTTQPTNPTASPGIPFSISALAVSNPAPNYQWQACAPGSAFWYYIGGMISPQLTLTAPDSSMNGYMFRAVATCVGEGPAFSLPATLTVNSPPSISGLHAVPALSGPLGKVYIVGSYSLEGGTLASANVNPGALPMPSGGWVQVSGAASPTDYTLTVTNTRGESASAVATVLPGSLSVLAGHPAGFGNLDGVGAAARFGPIGGVTRDPSGNLYVLDYSNDVIRKVSPDGTVSTFAGAIGQSGFVDGMGAAARFCGLTGITVDPWGALVVTDGPTIRRISANGFVSTWMGARDRIGHADGPLGIATLCSPASPVFDAFGTLFVSDGCTIRRITADGTITTIAGSPGTITVRDGSGAEASFGHIGALAADGGGNIIACDLTCIRKITPDGVVSTIAGIPGKPGATDGEGSVAMFCEPSGVAVAPTGEIFVADMYLNEIRMIYTDGVVSTIFGAPSSTPGIHDGSGREATLFGPGAMCFDSDGYLYFADGGGSKQPCVIRRASPSGWLVTLAGEPCSYWTSPPIYDFGANAAFRDPGAACVDLLGNLLVSDGGLIRRVSPTGTVSTMVDLGTGVSSQGIAQDSQGYVYSVDTAANVIRKSWFGGYQVFAGQVGVAGYVDGTIPTALFNHPTGLVADSSGNFYVADSWNCAIRKISPSGVVSTLAMGGALLNCNIGGMAIDANGNLYVSQVGGTCVLKVTSTGIVSILAGSPYDRGYADGPNNAARFDSPAAVATDPLGNVYVMDQGNNAVRVISPYGIVGTLAGRPGLEGNIPGVLPSTLSLNRSFQVGIAYNSVTGDIDIVLGDGVMRIGR